MLKCALSGFFLTLEIHIIINVYLSQLLLSMAYPKLNMHVVYVHHSYAVLVYFVYFLKHVYMHMSCSRSYLYNSLGTKMLQNVSVIIIIII